MRIFLAVLTLLVSQSVMALASDWDDCRSGDSQSAVSGCSAVIDGAGESGLEKSGLAEAYVLRGQARVALEEYDPAVIDFGKAIELEPINADAYFERGLAFKARGDYESAIRDFDTAAKLNASAAPAEKLGSGATSNDSAAVEESTSGAPSAPVTKPASKPKPAASKSRTSKPKSKKVYKKKKKRQASKPKPKPKPKKQAKQKPKDDVWGTVNKQIQCSVNGGFDC